MSDDLPQSQSYAKQVLPPDLRRPGARTIILVALLFVAMLTGMFLVGYVPHRGDAARARTDANERANAVPSVGVLTPREGGEFSSRVFAECWMPIGGEQQTKSGLKTAWGERPFVQPELVLKMQPDGSEVVSGWKSYIEQGAVITRGSDTSEYILYENLWQFSITEDLRAASDLPVTIKIVSRPKKGEEQ